MDELVFLLDVDNTLLDNDRLKTDLDARVRDIVGDSLADDFWRIYEDVRKSEEYVDFPATLDGFSKEHPDAENEELRRTVMGIQFRAYVYPGAEEAIRYLGTIGAPVIISDGDPVFQKEKVDKSGLSALVSNKVMLTVHKQDEMATIFETFPASHYAMIDDKTTILADVAREHADCVTTVLVCQGKYARIRATPRPDMVVPHIADLVHIPRWEFFEQEPAADSDPVAARAS